MVPHPFQRAVGNSFLIEDAALKLLLLARSSSMLDSPKNDGKPKTYALLVRTAQLQANHGIPKNTEHETSAFAIGHLE
jgi:hypothetical protein